MSKNSKSDDEVVKECITPTKSSRRQKQQCKFSKDHESFNLLTLKEESNSWCLGEALLLNSAKCSKCSKMSLKNNAPRFYNEPHTIMSNMKPILCCTEFLTCGHVKCNCCICFYCKVKVELGSSDRGSRKRIN